MALSERASHELCSSLSMPIQVKLSCRPLHVSFGGTEEDPDSVVSVGASTAYCSTLSVCNLRAYSVNVCDHSVARTRTPTQRSRWVLNCLGLVMGSKPRGWDLVIMTAPAVVC